MAKWPNFDAKNKGFGVEMGWPKILTIPQVVGLPGCKECVTRRGNTGFAGQHLCDLFCKVACFA
jgi:hypothetical protein